MPLEKGQQLYAHIVIALFDTEGNIIFPSGMELWIENTQNIITMTDHICEPLTLTRALLRRPIGLDVIISFRKIQYPKPLFWKMFIITRENPIQALSDITNHTISQAQLMILMQNVNRNETMSLLSGENDTKRMILPCRSTECNHIQSFDLINYLNTSRTWNNRKCPVCSQLMSYNSLYIDEWTYSILQNTPSWITEVGVYLPSLHWTMELEDFMSGKFNFFLKKKSLQN